MAKPLCTDWQGVLCLDRESQEKKTDMSLDLDLDIRLGLQGAEIGITLPCSFEMLESNKHCSEVDSINSISVCNVPLSEEVNLVGATADESMAIEALRQLRGMFNISDDKLVSCEMCEQQFHSKPEFQNHLAYCQQASNRLHVCSICKQSFVRKSDLGNHIACHQVDKPHTCVVCGSVYRKMADLQNHIVSHQTSRPHRCQECGADFQRPSSLTNHLKIHSYHPGRAMLSCVDVNAQNANVVEHPSTQLSLLSTKVLPVHTGIRNEQLITESESGLMLNPKMFQYEEDEETFYDCQPTNTGSVNIIRNSTTCATNESSSHYPDYMSGKFSNQPPDDKCNMSMFEYVEVPAVSANVDIITSDQNDRSQNCILRVNNLISSESRSTSHFTNAPVKVETLPYYLLDETQSQEKAFTIVTGDADVGLPVQVEDADIGLSTSGNKRYLCSYCGEVFSREKALTAHVQVHEREPRDLCCDCGEPFMDPQSLLQHQQHCAGSARQGDPLSCVEHAHCNDNKHILSMPTQLSKEKHNCTSCDKKFTTKQKLFRHMWIHRKKQFVCEVCGVSLNHQEGLEEHRRALHPGETPHVCQDCGRGFASRQGLWEHSRVHGSNSISQYWCLHCNKTFSSRQGYLIHTRTHTGERPYGCRFCLKAFRDGGTLRKHERIHTGERPHVCPLCYRAFNQKVVLREHVRWVHAANRDVLENDADHLFICEVCNHLLGDREELCAHIVKHSDDLAKAAKAQPKQRDSSTDVMRPVKVVSQTRSKKLKTPKERKTSKVSQLSVAASPALPISTTKCPSVSRPSVQSGVCPSTVSPVVKQSRLASSQKTKGSYTCQMCNETFPKRKQLLKHVNIHI